MRKRQVTLPDGRYLIYYDFDDEKKPAMDRESLPKLDEPLDLDKALRERDG